MVTTESYDESNGLVLHRALILIVDDQEVNIRVLKGVLGRAGYTRLLSTTDSRKVFSILTTAQPDLILLDLMMPEMDGFQVMEQIKPAIPKGDYLPILVLTADMNPKTSQRAFSLGATDFLTKPFDHVEVLQRINNLLRTRALHLELQRQNQILEEKVKARTEELNKTLNQVITAQEVERRRISMEIHDGPLQSLGVSMMGVDRALRRHETGEQQLVLDELRELRGSLASAITEVRGVLADLSLEILTSRGLVPALKEYITRFSGMTDASVSLTLDEDKIADLPPNVQLLMYRLAQEALSNVRKHAQAKHVELSIEIEEDHLAMTISDDGIGFSVDTVLSEHHAGVQIGLRSMLERIQSAQGNLWIDSAHGKGTTLTFWCPLNADAGDEG